MANGTTRSCPPLPLELEMVILLRTLRAVSKQRYVSPLDFGVVYTGLGDKDSAFQWLEKTYQERTMRIQELPQPMFDSLRSDSRFLDLMQRIGLPF